MNTSATESTVHRQTAPSDSPRLWPALMIGVAALLAAASATAATTTPFIVEADSANRAAHEVERVGGHVLRSLPIINGVSADLTARQAKALGSHRGVRLYADASVRVSETETETETGSSTTPSTSGSTTTSKSATSSGTWTATTKAAATKATNSPSLVYSASTTAPPSATEVDARALHTAGKLGQGVTIAVVDTGFTPYASPYTYDNWGTRVLAGIDFAASNGGANYADLYGHGTQITSVMGSAAKDNAGRYYGIAPGANFVIVRAFDATGSATYANVIAGLNWILQNKAKYNIRIVNLSLGATPSSFYWNDPLDQAVMKAWAAGLVVVTAAGNAGPVAQSITVPANVPYVITVGAFTDAHNPNANHQGALASFSSAGPTLEGFVKPEVVAPGGHLVATMPNDQTVATALTTQIFGTVKNPYTLFPLSGTSQAAAVASGVAALLLQAEPTLGPDDVKCKLIASARPAVTGAGKLAYSVFQQGAGLIDALGATSTSATGCANQGLNIAADLAGTAHFGGPANQQTGGAYFIMAMSGLTPAGPVASDGYTWTPASTWSTTNYLWSQSYVWTYPYSWQQAYPWRGNSAAMATMTGNTVTPNSNGWAHVKSILPSTTAPVTSGTSSLYPAQEE